MNSKTSERDNDNALVPWWWPGHWFHIVYSIWFDQAWYKENVKPQLKEEQRRRIVFFQAILGTAIATLIISFTFVYLLAITSSLTILF